MHNSHNDVCDKLNTQIMQRQTAFAKTGQIRNNETVIVRKWIEPIHPYLTRFPKTVEEHNGHATAYNSVMDLRIVPCNIFRFSHTFYEFTQRTKI